MNQLSMSTCVNALNGAALSRKAAFQIELAVGLAIFMNAGDTNKDAKAELCEAYANAGYECLASDGMDYKTVNRRINVTADLFNKLHVRTVKKWAGALTEDMLIAAVIEGLKPYELLNVSDVQRYCEPPAPKIAANDQHGHTAVAPAHSILNGPENGAATTGHNKVISMFRRAADQLERDGRKVQTQHLSLVVPKAIDRDELIEMAMQLLTLAEQVKAPQEQAA